MTVTVSRSGSAKDIRAGIETLTMRVLSQGDNSVSSLVNFTIDVKQFYDLSISATPVSKQVTAGTLQNFGVKIKNDGNGPDDVTLTITDQDPNEGWVYLQSGTQGGPGTLELSDIDVGYKQEKTVFVYVNVTKEDAIDDILDDIAWPTLWGRDLGVGADLVSWWWEDDRSASIAIDDLVDSELGRFYVAADGVATFRSRQFSDDPVMTLPERAPQGHHHAHALGDGAGQGRPQGDPQGAAGPRGAVEAGGRTPGLPGREQGNLGGVHL